ncbi:MAG TPA: class IV adenylate cyclase [Bryobacteraceae bacterium]|nr:class IV adenylate cyclase [Bryobacteraceae bacterium]
MSAPGQLENEIKIRLTDAGDGQRRLEAAGFSLRRERVFEVNILYDSPDGALRKSDRVLRLRRVNGACLLTLKGPAERERHKSREELETETGNFEITEAILCRMGYSPVFRYEKFRAEYGKDEEPGTVTLDETPVGTFLELEGEPMWVDSTAGLLGFSTKDYIFSSYARIFLDCCAISGVTATNMVFRIGK